MHRDICLRAENEADLKAALPWAVWQYEEDEGPEIGEWRTSGEGYALDLIGAIQTADAIMGEPDPETGEALVETPAQWDDRYHANLRLIDGFAPDVPEGVIVHPTQQRRVFA